MNPPDNITTKAPQTEKEKFLESIRRKKANGLTDVKFFTASKIPCDVDEEKVYAELNRLDAAPDLPDPEVLGKFSLKAK